MKNADSWVCRVPIYTRIPLLLYFYSLKISGLSLETHRRLSVCLSAVIFQFEGGAAVAAGRREEEFIHWSRR